MEIKMNFKNTGIRVCETLDIFRKQFLFPCRGKAVIISVCCAS